MKRYERVFGGWKDTDTGERVDNRLLVDELDYLWNTHYYQNMIKCDTEAYDFVLTDNNQHDRLISVAADSICFYPLIRFVPPSFDYRAVIEEALNALVRAMGIPPEYFEAQP